MKFEQDDHSIRKSTPGTNGERFHFGNQPIPYRCRTIIITLMLYALLAGLVSPVKAEHNAPQAGDIGFGIKVAYSAIQGEYRDEFSSRMLYGVSAFYFLTRYLYGELELSFAEYPLSRSGQSNLYSYPASLGPILNLPLGKYLHWFAGAAIKGEYLTLTADKLNREENTFKIGYILKTGFSIPLGRGIGIRTGFEYASVELSNKAFITTNYTAGIWYNYQAMDRYRKRDDIATVHRDARQYRTERIFNSGVKAFESGRLDIARERFTEATAKDPNHAAAKEYLKKIDEIESWYRQAQQAIEDNQPIKAIPLLEKIKSIMPQAREDLAAVRLLLRSLVPSLEKEGITAYENNQYQRCITIMQQIQLIDPDNGIMKVYLPRAIKRQQAVQKFR